MRFRTAFRSGLSAIVLCAALGNGWPQARVSLAEQRTITVNGQSKLVTSKLSRLNANTSRVRSVMNLNFTFGFHHYEGKSVIGSMLNRFAAQEGWTVTHFHFQDRNHPAIDDRSKITLAELNKNMVIFANHISNWGNQGNSPLNLAVQDYLEHTGGGMVLMHGSGDSQEAGWTYYREKLHPVNFRFSGNIRPGTIFRPASAIAHPVLEGGILSEGKVINGEWYDYQNHISRMNPLAEVLMMVDPASCSDCNLIGVDILPGGTPISWVMPVGKGWVGYFGEGHSDQTLTQFTQEVWDRFFKQMLFYVAGYDTTSLVSALPAYFRNHSGISFDPTAMAVFIEKPDYHKVGLYDAQGTNHGEFSGRGVAEYNFEENRRKLRNGVYVLRVEYGQRGNVSNRYVIWN